MWVIVARMRIVVTLPVVFGLATGPIAAQGQPAAHVGVASCETWTADRRAPETAAAVADTQWVIGFLAGIGHMGLGELQPLHGIDDQGVWAWLDSYCGVHPAATIEEAVAAFSVAHPR
jgi:hypothetical protein